jgi:hypothetical protein
MSWHGSKRMIMSELFCCPLDSGLWLGAIAIEERRLRWHVMRKRRRNRVRISNYSDVTLSFSRRIFNFQEFHRTLSKFWNSDKRSDVCATEHESSAPDFSSGEGQTIFEFPPPFWKNLIARVNIFKFTIWNIITSIKFQILIECIAHFLATLLCLFQT